MGRKYPNYGPPKSWPKYVGLAVLVVATVVVVYFALIR